jgi:2-dehydropantoate 2-reductase
MNVTMVGCGALGSVIAFHLHGSGYPGLNLEIIQRPGEHLDAIIKNGLRLYLPDGSTKTLRIPISSGRTGRGRSDLMIVLVKSGDTEKASRIIEEELAPGGVALTLQNGLGNAEKLAGILGADRVAAGITTFGGYRKAPGEVVVAGEGSVVFGPWKKGMDLDKVRDLFAMAALNPELVKDPREAICRKLVLNAAVNPLAAIVRQNNGAIIGNPDLAAVMDLLLSEAVEAMSLKGVVIDLEEIRKTIMETLEKTSSNRASMLQDIEAGRRTEIDNISGQILAAGEAHGIDFPCTRVITLLVRGLERGFPENGR